MVKIKPASRWSDHRVSQTVGKSVATPRWAVLVVNLASLFALWSNCSAARVEIYNLTAHITQDSGAAVHLRHRRRRTRGAAGTKGQSESANGGVKHRLSLSEFCLWTGMTHFVLKNYHRCKSEAGHEEDGGCSVDDAAQYYAPLKFPDMKKSPCFMDSFQENVG